MFEHSVKVPRHYKVAANILKKVSTEGGSVKSLLYDNKLRHFRTNVLFALITETIKHAKHIESIFESSGLLEKESRLDPWLAKILTAELLFGKKALPGKSKPEQTILSYKEHFEKFSIEHEGDLKSEAVRRPRYVRVNTNLLTTSDAIREFQDEGYHFIRCTSGSYNDFLKQIQSLTEYDFTQDYHIKTVFVFPPGTKLHEHNLYLENKIILQDKATAMAVPLLAAPPGSTVLDMCAAPGMKTTQLAAFMKNEGKIYAVERNEQRYQTLCDFVEKTGSKCVETLHKDSLEMKRGDYDDVEYILLDPSCSGSGMDFCVHNYIEETRLAKLTSLQEKFLKHAMNSFPKAKRIVYSTCSLYPEENERVITNIVKTSRAKWRVQDVKELLKGQWNNFGSGMYGSIGTRCLYAKPDSDFTTGFFLAVLDRDQKDVEKKENQEIIEANNEKPGKRKVSKKNPSKDNQSYDKAINVNDTEEEKDLKCSQNDEEDENSNFRKKKSNPDDYCVNNDNSNTDTIGEVEEKKISKSKKKTKNLTECEKEKDAECLNIVVDDSVILNTEFSCLKKKKKKRIKEIDIDIDNHENVTSKRNSSKNVDQEQLLDEATNSTEDAPRKKKKKKSKCLSDDDEKYDIIETQEPKKKRKKM
ncbi:28S rRNA (cytosine-C(5))-methyltransferase [Battus philenor]|uniref:28S rRNA (cytosine-C(5))-methyltransferase n=1 Tax=Battus philenor TaxID=42288 RepID=UPI0035CEF0AB